MSTHAVQRFTRRGITNPPLTGLNNQGPKKKKKSHVFCEFHSHLRMCQTHGSQKYKTLTRKKN